MAQAPQRPRPIALRIELLDVAPFVWRRVLVSNQWTLASLHGYLQWAMGWTNSHAHEFEVGEGIVAPERIRSLRHPSSSARKLRQRRQSEMAPNRRPDAILPLLTAFRPTPSIV
jgi:hypothetical protein